MKRRLQIGFFTKKKIHQSYIERLPLSPFEIWGFCNGVIQGTTDYGKDLSQSSSRIFFLLSQ